MAAARPAAGRVDLDTLFTKGGFRSAFIAAPHPYLLLTPDTRIVDANDAYLNATKTTRDCLIGRTYFEAFPDNPDAAELQAGRPLRASLEAVVQSQKPHRMARQRHDIRNADGVYEERWWDPVNIPVLEGNALIGILHHCEDVTIRHNAINAATAGWATLTDRERDVLSAFARGLSTKQIAAELEVSAKSVEYYRLRLFEKLGVSTQGALIRIGVLASL